MANTTKAEAAQDAHDYFDSFYEEGYPGDQRPDHIKPRDGENDAKDAFRHTYTSVIFTLERGELTARLYSWFNERYGDLIGQTEIAKNMDFWNSEVGHLIAEEFKGTNWTPDAVAQRVKEALENGDMIFDPTSDFRSMDTEKPDLSEVNMDDPISPEGLIDPFDSPDEIVQPTNRPLAGWLPGVLGDLGTAGGTTSPLVLDLDGDGVELAALNGPGSVYWDIDLDGFGESSGWISGGDGLLALDVNGDGIINDHTELFGDQTGSPNGFAALAAYDTNADGLITSADAQFSVLLVWTDDNADGYSGTDELHTLSDLGITSIDLGYSDVNYTISGNEIKQESTFTINGQSRTIVDAWFAYDNVNTVYAQDYTLDGRTLLLPILRGYGTLPDLHIAMSQDETLLTMVQELAVADTETILSNAFDLRGHVEDILYRWAGVDGVDPASRGPNMDARQLEFLEALSGEEWLQYGTQPNPELAASKILIGAFEKAFFNMLTPLLLQTDAKSLFPETASYDVYTGEVEGAGEAGIIEALWFAGEHTSNMTGDGGNDAYIYNLGDGSDTIIDYDGTDRLIFGAGIAENDIRFWKNGYHLELHVDDEVVTLYDQFATYNNRLIETATFTDGATLDLASNLIFTGTAVGENVYGLINSDDVIVGAGGNDTLRGDSGNDTYVYNLGDGSDTIIEYSGTADTLSFGAGITSDDLSFRKNGYSLEIHVDDEVITLQDHLAPYYERQIETATFTDGSSLDLLNNLTFTGTAAGESIYGTNNDDVIVGAGGNDTLRGDSGNDTYVYNLGDGSDTIIEYSGTADMLSFGAGITSDDLSFRKNGYSLEIHVDDEVITLQDHLAPYYERQIETATFTDGSSLDLLNNLTFTGTSAGESIYGTNNDDVLYGAGGADYLFGYGGADTFAWLAEDLDGSSDTIRDFSLTAGDKLDISDVLEGYDPMSDAITDFVHITSGGGNSYLRVDADGGADNFVQIAQISYTTGLGDEEALETSGTLITV